jgi:uncharacterized protein YbjT (DUF2867 family)
MKIIVTGSLGNISKPLTEELVQKGHDVTVISRKAEKQAEIEALGAKAAIGSVEDVEFLTETLNGADAAYLMEAPGNFFDPAFDYVEYIDKIGRVFVQAVKQSGIKRIVHLSSIGAHTDKGNGILAFHYNIEKMLNTLPADVAIAFMRPVGFYYNMFSFVPMIKGQGAIFANYHSDFKEPWVSTIDIAAVIAEEIVQPFTGRHIRYITSDEATSDELATILGEAIGKPDLKWVAVPDEQILTGLISAGINKNVAKGLVEMNAGRRGGALYIDYNLHKPVFGKVKLKDFARDFAAVYNQGGATAGH